MGLMKKTAAKRNMFRIHESIEKGYINTKYVKKTNEKIMFCTITTTISNICLINVFIFSIRYFHLHARSTNSFEVLLG